MSFVSEKIKGKAEVVAGKVEQTVGKVIGSDKMENEGAVTEAKGNIREDVADITKNVKGAAAAIVKPPK